MINRRYFLTTVAIGTASAAALAACGTPALASDSPGLRESVQNRVTGFGGEVVTGRDHVASGGDHRLEGHGGEATREGPASQGANVVRSRRRHHRTRRGQT